MGLPELTFSLKKAADNVATRVSSGIVAMILRDAKANGLHTINRESDIPSELGAANIAAIKRAMLGYITKPTTLYVRLVQTPTSKLAFRLWPFTVTIIWSAPWTLPLLTRPLWPHRSRRNGQSAMWAR